jgi:hypothetical protein
MVAADAQVRILTTPPSLPPRTTACRFRPFDLVRMTIIDSQVHAYEANTSKRPWHSVPSWPPLVTGDEMAAAMDTVGVDGAIFISDFGLYQYDASRRRRCARKRQPSGVRRRTHDCTRPPRRIQTFPDISKQHAAAMPTLTCRRSARGEPGIRIGPRRLALATET